MIRAALVLLLFALPCAAQTVQDREIARADGAMVPIREYAAQGGAACPDLLILSHGFGGSRRVMGRIARAAAAAGFRVIAMEHEESNRDELRAVLRAEDRRTALSVAVKDGTANAARAADLDATWDYAMQGCRPKLTVLGGHSMGAQTTMIEAGARALVAPPGRDRFDAYIALSPQGPGDRFPDGAWAGVTKPVLMATGTRDRALEGEYSWRLPAFAGLRPGGKRLAVIEGATHFDLGAIGTSRQAALVPRIVVDFLHDLGSDPGDGPAPLPGVRYKTK